MESKEGNNSFMIKVATFVVDRRNLSFLLFAIGIIFSVVAAGWVKVENDLAAYLSDDTETSQGIDLMDEEFVTYGTAKVMVTNIDYDTAEELSEMIEARDDVSMLEFDNTDEHYNNFSALYSITFKYPEDDERALVALDEVKGSLAGYDLFVSTSMGDQTADIINNEMTTVSMVVAVLVLAVLLFTSQTWAEVPVLILTFVSSAILAAGTNFIFGTISFVSNSVTVVLQLALSIDYAVIFCNRYKEEHEKLPIREADIVALSKAIPEIFSSSLTTMGGLIAMMFMQYGIGPDMALCLIKAVLLSLLAVFTLMPGLIMLFGNAMDKTKHKNFVPDIPFVGKFAYLVRFVVPPVFMVILVGAFLVSNKCPYVYGYSTLETPVKNEIQIADEMIEETFGKENFAALIIPRDSYETEAKLLHDLEQCPEIEKITALTSTEAMDGYMLTDKLTARQFSELMEMDYEVAELLYAAYAVDDEEYGHILNSSEYSIPFIDLMMFLYDEIDKGYVSVDDDVMEDITDAHDKMQIARDQLEGENYSRMLVYLNLPEEGEETFEFLGKMHDIAHRYYEGRVLVAGESTSQLDLKNTFARDNTVVNVVSILAVLAVLLFTFMSVGMPILLILVIQGAIWLTFSFPVIQHQNVFFMGYLIVSSIQMGANIDYAIVISGRFLELKDKMSKKDAIVETMNFAFPTIITSGTILALAGILIGNMSSDASICGIGQALGRGTIISILLVMFVLPEILLLGEKIIDKTSFKVSVPLTLNHETGIVRIDGVVQGNISGHFVGEMKGILRGDANILLATGKMSHVEDEEGGGKTVLTYNPETKDDAGAVTEEEPAGKDFGPGGPGEEKAEADDKAEAKDAPAEDEKNGVKDKGETDENK